jgi:hypothetical protein
MMIFRAESASWPRRAFTVVALTLTVATLTSGVASAAIRRSYFGKTPQNGYAYGETTTREGRTKLNFAFVEPIIMTCEDSSAFVWGFGFFSDSRRGTPLGSDNRIDLEYRDVVSMARFGGRFWPGHARGVVDLTLAGLDATDQAMLCTSGEVSWEADRVRVRTRSSLEASKLDGITRMRVTQDGDVRVRTRRL